MRSKVENETTTTKCSPTTATETTNDNNPYYYYYKMVQVVQQHPHHTQPVHQRRNSSISSSRKRSWWSSSASWISSLLYNNRRKRSNNNYDGRGILRSEGLTSFTRYGNADENNANAAAGSGGGSSSTVIASSSSRMDDRFGCSTIRRRGRQRRPMKKACLLLSIIFLGGMMTLYVTIIIVTSTPIQPHHLYESKNKKKSSFLSSIMSALSAAVFFGSHDPSTTTTTTATTTTTTTTFATTTTGSFSTKRTTLKDASFRILCTSTNRKIEWGSYQIRCRDLKSWAERCTAAGSGSSGGKGGVYVVTDLSFSDMYRRRWIRWWLGQLRDEEQYRYDATIFVKAFPSLNRLLPKVFGDNLFVDLVDEYKYQDDEIPRQYKLIAQTSWQGHEKFPNHQTSTVEHWYNSYPKDMLKSEKHSTGKRNKNNGNYDDDYPDGMPAIVDINDTEDSQRSCLHFATIWNTKRDKGPHEGGCPILSEKHSSLNITYDCLDLEFDISKWYLDYILREPGQGTSSTTTSEYFSPDHLDDSRHHHHHYHDTKFHSVAEARVDMATTLRDPMLGPGKLYYNIFQNYDVLVVLTKNDTEKLHYGNVQRTISQMRSGVPVLLDVRGRVLHDFMDKYNYTCAFQRYPDHSDHDNVSGGGDDGKRRRYWTFDEAVEQMRSADVRRQCQRQGLDIVKDFSPSKIGQKFLRTVGYRGDFVC